MKSLIATVAVAAALAVPAVSFAQQSNGPVTRAQVRAELIQLEQAGYNPASDRVNYPEEIQAAEAKIHGQQNVAAQADTSGYGAQPAAAAESGSPNKVKRIADGAPVYKGR
ncbi:DUF4148 domain-containing protein [Burkholderia pseudomallei]|uniref:Exported protein n=6 Tax=Burkholderia pseudomallei TaxID=28450 RepID=Q63JG8_BURPS|nr:MULTISPECIES: DUF4148 domain-containing protein [Burkholderia]EIF57279.1 hypothetical protein BP1258A_4349 [Burkholderia pseudomallei 1258a]KGX77521.1 hypothetical protein Y033_3249 [Burkholderia pseudomallei MSHR435]ABA52765.1 conserved hypothetical protein [Burkholderia pseudomallei 1710b]ABN86367.1 conserved hypothetical protein [Burkholderia pseudomallei 668]ABN94129.1 conserved hypothetical protein [Burkholderia pseudomallei 1106a]